MVRPFFDSLVLEPVSRRPLRLSEDVVRAVNERPVPALQCQDEGVAAATAPGAPSASIVVVTFNNLVVTRLCLETLLASRQMPGYELVLVDNRSTDGTAEYLQALADKNRGVRVILNDANLGFAAANNRGLRESAGDVLVLLNNDTIVTPTWLDRLLDHLRDRAVGLVGPVTNRIGNEAEIETEYRTYGEMMAFAARHTAARRGQSFDIPTLCMYCLAMRRDTFERLGPLDERFEVGLLEDDDYSMRAHAAGYRVLCAEDAFVHHFGQASFGDLFATGDYGRLLEANRRRFEEKWGVSWRPYNRRHKPQYDAETLRTRELVCRDVPPETCVLMVSRGDPHLVDLPARRGRHFPSTADGGWAGHYPATGSDAVAELERARAGGADFIVFPPSSGWWLEHYAALREHLVNNYTLVTHPGADATAAGGGRCTVFDLRPKQGRPAMGRHA